MTTLLAGLCVAVAVGAAALAVTGWTRTGGRRVARPARADGPTRAEWLVQAGVEMTPLGFWAITTCCGAVAFAVVTAVTRAPVVAVVPGVAAAFVPGLVLAHRRQERLRAWQAAWPDALRELLANIAAGRSLGQALGALGDTGPDPLRSVFTDFPALSRMFGTAAALEQVKTRMSDATSDRVVEVLVVAHERGGSIVRDVLEDLVVATTRDLQVLDEIETDALEMRINARAVLVLPWFVLVALTVRPGPFRDFYRSSGGVLVLALAGILGAGGSWWLGRLGRRMEEPRVFAPSARSAASGARGS